MRYILRGNRQEERKNIYLLSNPGDLVTPVLVKNLTVIIVTIKKGSYSNFKTTLTSFWSGPVKVNQNMAVSGFEILSLKPRNFHGFELQGVIRIRLATKK